MNANCLTASKSNIKFLSASSLKHGNVYGVGAFFGVQSDFIKMRPILT